MTDLKLGVVEDSEWIRRWKEGESFWHSDKTTALYHQGHTVVGVELAEQAIVELLEENNIAHSVEDLDDIGKVFKSTDGRMTLYAANMFHVPAETFGKFDVIWDSKSFTSANFDDHTRYRDSIYAIMKPDCLYYLKTLVYDGGVWQGPPHSVSSQVVEATFGDACKIELKEEIQTDGNLADNAKEAETSEKQITDVAEDTEVTTSTETSSQTKNTDESLPVSEEMAKLDIDSVESVESIPSTETDTRSEQPGSTKYAPRRKSSLARAAIMKSNFLFHRRYKLTFKDPKTIVE